MPVDTARCSAPCSRWGSCSPPLPVLAAGGHRRRDRRRHPARRGRRRGALLARHPVRRTAGRRPALAPAGAAAAVVRMSASRGVRERVRAARPATRSPRTPRRTASTSTCSGPTPTRRTCRSWSGSTAAACHGQRRPPDRHRVRPGRRRRRGLDQLPPRPARLLRPGARRGERHGRPGRQLRAARPGRVPAVGAGQHHGVRRDPDSVTIFGISAGGASVNYLMTSPLARVCSTARSRAPAGWRAAADLRAGGGAGRGASPRHRIPNANGARLRDLRRQRHRGLPAYQLLNQLPILDARSPARLDGLRQRGRGRRAVPDRHHRRGAPRDYYA